GTLRVVVTDLQPDGVRDGRAWELNHALDLGPVRRQRGELLRDELVRAVGQPGTDRQVHPRVRTRRSATAADPGVDRGVDLPRGRRWHLGNDVQYRVAGRLVQASPHRGPALADRAGLQRPASLR